MLNEIRLIGRVGKDPDVKHTQTQKAVATFSLATWESYFDKNKGEQGEWMTVTEWHNIVIWGDQAERANERIKKGDLVLVTGKVRTRSWDDNEGKKHYITEVVGAYKTFPKSDKSYQPKEPASPNDEQNFPQPEGNDDLPF